MTQQELEYNKRCAEFLGWTYISSIDIKEGSYHTSIKAGWYTKVPRVLALGLTQYLYKGRSHNSLQFHSDWNWIMKVVEVINMIPNPKNLSDTTLYTHRLNVQSILRSANKEAVVQAINQFLIWYNENKTKKT